MDIRTGQPSFDDDELNYVLDAVKSEWVTMGYYVKEFERKFAEYVGAKHAIAVNSGTAALHLALVALGIGEGDEVIVPATTFVATANAVTYTGATPVIVDVNKHDWCIDIDKAEQAITARTKAIIPVHLYGATCDLTELHVLAQEHNLFIVEDAAEALGARWNGHHVGTFGEIGCFSFYGNKTITTGEGGMVVTDDDELANLMRLYRGQGQSDRRYWHEVVGFNYRMTDLQGALGVAQMGKLEQFLQARHRLLKVYSDHLSANCEVQEVSLNSTHGAWAMAVLFPSVSKRLQVQNQLTINGIETRPIFYALNDLPPYLDSTFNHVAIKLNVQGLVLPLHPGMTNDDVKRICEIINGVVDDYEEKSA